MLFYKRPSYVIIVLAALKQLRSPNAWFLVVSVFGHWTAQCDDEQTF